MGLTIWRSKVVRTGKTNQEQDLAGHSLRLKANQAAVGSTTVRHWFFLVSSSTGRDGICACMAEVRMISWARWWRGCKTIVIEVHTHGEKFRWSAEGSEANSAAAACTQARSSIFYLCLCIRKADLVEHGPTNKEGGPGTEAKRAYTTMGDEAGRELNQ